MLLIVGALFVVLSSLTSFAAFAQLGRTVPVLVAARDIDRGEPLQAGDFEVLEIASGQSSSAVGIEQSTELLGQLATVDLPRGSLVTSASIALELPLEQGSSIVGISLSPAQLPATPLRAGDVIRIVSTPIAQGEPPAAPPPTLGASVHLVRHDENGGTTILDVLVPTAQAADLAARAATGRIAIVLDGFR